MSLVKIPGNILYPARHVAQTFSTGVALQNSASGHRFAYLLRVPKTGTLDKFEFYCPLYSGTNTPRFSFQDVDLATAFPDGTVDQFRTGTPTGGAWFAPGLITSDGTDGGSKRSVTAGDYLACVIDFSAYTSGALQGLTMLAAMTTNRAFYGATFNGSVWGTASGAAVPVIILKYSDGTYVSVLEVDTFPTNDLLSQGTFNSGSTPDEVGIKFQLPFRATVIGAGINIDADSDITVKLYAADDTLLASGTADTTVRNGAADDVHNIPFTGTVTLERNTTYRLTVVPGAATDCRYFDSGFVSTAIMADVLGGTNWHLTHRTDAGSWTDTATRKPLGFHLWLSHIDDGSGATGFAGAPMSRVFSGM